jgi:hypothetical protein
MMIMLIFFLTRSPFELDSQFVDGPLGRTCYTNIIYLFINIYGG